MPALQKCQLKDMSPTDLAWLSGWLEGEGCFSTLPNNGRKFIRVCTGSTDLDTIQKAMEITGIGTLTKRKPGKSNKQYLWMWTVCAKADARALLETLLPHMGIRRSARMRELLEWADA